jgi:hypothetical protein
MVMRQGWFMVPTLRSFTTTRHNTRRYTVAAATRETDYGQEHAPATQLLFCAHPAGFSNTTCRINDCGVVVPPPRLRGAKRARAAAAASSAAAASASTETSAEGNCVLMEVVALGWPFLFVVTTRSVAVGAPKAYRPRCLCLGAKGTYTPVTHTLLLSLRMK